VGEGAPDGTSDTVGDGDRVSVTVGVVIPVGETKAVGAFVDDCVGV